MFPNFMYILILQKEDHYTKENLYKIVTMQSSNSALTMSVMHKEAFLKDDDEKIHFGMMEFTAVE